MPEYTININFGVLATKLARMLDPVIERTAFGLSVADTPPAHLRLPGLFSVDVPDNVKRSPDVVRAEFRTWVLASGFRDAIESVHLFLEEACFVCAVLEFGAGGAKSSGARWKEAVVAKRRRFHKKGLPDKLDYLGEVHSVSVPAEWRHHVLSLNAARNCLVHRAGRVSAAHDANDSGSLRVTWRRPELVAAGPDGEHTINESNQIVCAGESLRLRFTQVERVFAADGIVTFTAEEFSAICMTLFGFEKQLADLLEERARALGIAVRPPAPEPRQTA